MSFFLTAYQLKYTEIYSCILLIEVCTLYLKSQHCPARFKRKDRLGRHMLIHDLTKRLKCPFRNYLGCMSEFSRPDKLKRHLLTHSNVKRFSCSHCNRNFHRAQALKHHEMNKHSLKCDICSHVSLILNLFEILIG